MNFFLMMSGLDGNDQSKFEKWLAQYENVAAIDSFFEDNPDLLEPEGFTENVRKLKALAKKRDDVPVEPGQIRLLNQGMTNDPDEMTCVLVMSSRYDKRWLIAPFSPYTEPATQWELDTGIDFHAYRVVETWNAAVVPDYFLQVQSSFLRNADEAVRRDALALYYREQDGKEDPGEFRNRTGAPVRFELDPRNQYLANEAFQLEPLRAKAGKAEAFLREMKPRPWFLPRFGAEPGLAGLKECASYLKFDMPLLAKTLHPFSASFADMAKERSRKPEAGFFLTVSGRPEQIRVTLREDAADLEVLSENRGGPSGAFDSWLVVSKDGKPLAGIRGSRCTIAEPGKHDSICLADPEGNLFELLPAED